jgi:hypothetical protein
MPKISEPRTERSVSGVRGGPLTLRCVRGLGSKRCMYSAEDAPLTWENAFHLRRLVLLIPPLPISTSAPSRPLSTTFHGMFICHKSRSSSDLRTWNLEFSTKRYFHPLHGTPRRSSCRGCAARGRKGSRYSLTFRLPASEAWGLGPVFGLPT